MKKFDFETVVGLKKYKIDKLESRSRYAHRVLVFHFLWPKKNVLEQGPEKATERFFDSQTGKKELARLELHYEEKAEGLECALYVRKENDNYSPVQSFLFLADLKSHFAGCEPSSWQYGSPDKAESNETPGYFANGEDWIRVVHG